MAPEVYYGCIIASMAPPHILIVDNNLEKLDRIKLACQSAGYEVTGLSDAERALDTATMLQPIS